MEQKEEGNIYPGKCVPRTSVDLKGEADVPGLGQTGRRGESSGLPPQERLTALTHPPPRKGGKRGI